MKVLILENTAASGRLLSVGDVVDLSDRDATHLVRAAFATLNAEQIAAREAQLERDREIAATLRDESTTAAEPTREAATAATATETAAPFVAPVKPRRAKA